MRSWIAALNHRGEGKLNDLSQDRTFVWGRASQRQAWTPVWMA